jgi:small subunit ribosomal protein S16
MLKIRFFRTGRKHQPFYRIRVVNKNNPPASGRFIADVGFYNPLTKECEIDKEKTLKWIGNGAKPSDRVNNLLIEKKIIEGEKKQVVSLTNKRKEKMNKKAKEKKSAEEVPEVKEEALKEEVVEKEEKTEEVKEDKPADKTEEKKEEEKK